MAKPTTVSELKKELDPLREVREAKNENKRLNGRIKDLEKKCDTALTSLEAERRKKIVVPDPIKLPKLLRGPRDFVRVALGDVHGINMDKPSVGAALADIQALQPHEIILGGDMIDVGGFMAEHHVVGYVAETEYSIDEDIAAANGFLDQLQAAAPSAKILYLEGNHEHRIETWIVTHTRRHKKDSEMLRRFLGADRVLNLKERGIQFFGQADIHGNCRQPGFVKRGKCYFVHDITSSANAANDALGKVTGNVVFWHTHRQESKVIRRENVGYFGAWNPGCLCKLVRMWQHSHPNNWTNGYFLQIVGSSGSFLPLNISIIEGKSLLIQLMKSGILNP